MVDSERYLLTLMRYIELNPLRAGMVAAPDDYPWSSYRRNAQGARGPNADWLTPHEEYMRLGLDDWARQEAYRGLFATAVDQEDLAPPTGGGGGGLTGLSRLPSRCGGA